jgi:hypothetical protein
VRKLIAAMKISLDGTFEGPEGYAGWVQAWSAAWLDSPNCKSRSITKEQVAEEVLAQLGNQFVVRVYFGRQSYPTAPFGPAFPRPF